jgi:hypothetical protein
MPPNPLPETLVVPFPVPSRLLGEATRRTIAQLNRDYLEVCTVPGAAGDPRFGLREEVLQGLAQAGADTFRRLVQCPFVLFEVQVAATPRFAIPGRVSDSGASRPTDLFDEHGRRLAQAVFVVAARMAERSPLASRLAFALPPAADVMVRELSPLGLLEAAAVSASLQPRWRDHPCFWPMLLDAAQRNGGLLLQRVHTLGIRLLAAQVTGVRKGHERR